MAGFNPGNLLPPSDEDIGSCHIPDLCHPFSPIPLLTDEEITSLDPISMNDLDTILGVTPPPLVSPAPQPSLVPDQSLFLDLPEVGEDFRIPDQQPEYESLQYSVTQHDVRKFDESFYGQSPYQNGVQEGHVMLQHTQGLDFFDPRPFSALQPNTGTGSNVLGGYPVMYPGVNNLNVTNNANTVSSAYETSNSYMTNCTAPRYPVLYPGVNNLNVINNTNAVSSSYEINNPYMTNYTDGLNDFGTAYGINGIDSVNGINAINGTDLVNAAKFSSPNRVNKACFYTAQEKRTAYRNLKDNLIKLVGSHINDAMQEIPIPSTPPKCVGKKEIEIQMWTPPPKKTRSNSTAGSPQSSEKPSRSARGSPAIKQKYKTPPKVQRNSSAKKAVVNANAGGMSKTTSPNTPISEALHLSSPGTPTPSKSDRSIGVRIPYPKSWKDASPEDVFLFELKNAGGTWDMIRKSYNGVTHHGYKESALQSRYHGIKKNLGDPPHEDPSRPTASVTGAHTFDPLEMTGIINANGDDQQVDPRMDPKGAQEDGFDG
ncbi:hypothetical protein N7456_013650 [Penicillium angulare]|uniref:Uncharacterized protein n=1 Tax=Penicillium angulare TaxID=116970 RepID=A0A9W9JT46_9EURO|nr:hypothetical protein N7456_013650 [Penicillium angulare]